MGAAPEDPGHRDVRFEVAALWVPRVVAWDPGALHCAGEVRGGEGRLDGPGALGHHVAHDPAERLGAAGVRLGACDPAEDGRTAGVEVLAVDDLADRGCRCPTLEAHDAPLFSLGTGSKGEVCGKSHLRTPLGERAARVSGSITSRWRPQRATRAGALSSRLS